MDARPRVVGYWHMREVHCIHCVPYDAATLPHIWEAIRADVRPARPLRCRRCQRLVASPPSEPTEFRADGWPLCPVCGEDELWSPLIWPNLDERPPLKDFIAAGLSCYKCGWSKERTVNAPEMSPPGLVTDQEGHERLAEGGEEDAAIHPDNTEDLGRDDQ